MKYKNIGIIIMAICLHITKGLTVLITGVVTQTSGIATVANIFGENRLTGCVFLLSAILAIFALHKEKPIHTFLLILLQHVIILYSMSASLINIWKGSYSDGFVPMSDNGEVTNNSHLFIFNDQILFILFAIFYSASLKDVYSGTMNKISYYFKITIGK